MNRGAHKSACTHSHALSRTHARALPRSSTRTWCHLRRRPLLFMYLLRLFFRRLIFHLSASSSSMVTDDSAYQPLRHLFPYSHVLCILLFFLSSAQLLYFFVYSVVVQVLPLSFALHSSSFDDFVVYHVLCLIASFDCRPTNYSPRYRH